MSESNEAIEVTAPSVDEAIRQALDQLGAAEDDVVIRVLSTPRAGMLGLGARQARVRVERRAAEGARSGVMSPPPAPPQRQPEPTRQPPQRLPHPTPRPPQERAERRVEAPVRREESAASDDEGTAGRKAAGLDDQVREATTILSQILELMGERGEISTTEEDSEGIELVIKGDGSGLLIGRHGQTLDSLEYLVNRIQARRVKDAVPITVDTESYRERRRRQLHRMALSMAEQTKREHAPVTLDPMPPRDRRIVHLALKDDPLITTRSTGDGFLRVVEIIPVGERREGTGGRGGRPRGGGGGGGGGGRGREHEPEPARERDQPIGQQGGFKHGQKRMF
jgi:spoIIIJ-associated protein